MSKRDRIVDLLNAGTHTARQIAVAVRCALRYVRAVSTEAGIKPKRAGHVVRVPEAERITQPRREDEIRADLRAQLIDMCSRQHAAVTAARMRDPL
jgi:hypothetical protein